MRLKSTEIIAGTTVRTTFVSSGTTVSTNASALFDSTETLVDSVSAISSGAGFWYVIHLVTTPGWYVNQWTSVIEANTYIHRQFIRAILPEVD